MKLKQIWRTYRFLILVSGLVILLDQLSKEFIRVNFVEGVDMWAPWPGMIPYARIIHITNTGVAFGMFQGMGSIFKVLSLLVSLGIIYYFFSIPTNDWVLRLAMGMLLGGAIGNLIDRVVRGSVTDFISVGNFPVFNVADSAVTLGVITLALGVWLEERREKQAAAAASAAEPLPPAAEPTADDEDVSPERRSS